MSQAVPKLRTRNGVHLYGCPRGSISPPNQADSAPLRVPHPGDEHQLGTYWVYNRDHHPRRPSGSSVHVQDYPKLRIGLGAAQNLLAESVEVTGMVPDLQEFLVDQLRYLQLTLNRSFYLLIVITALLALILWRLW